MAKTKVIRKVLTSVPITVAEANEALENGTMLELYESRGYETTYEDFESPIVTCPTCGSPTPKKED